MLNNPQSKYKPFPPIDISDRTWPNQVIQKPPIWCSVDLRDGNQALIEPMDVTRKIKMFECLVSLGFKQIEVGFPSASQIEFDFIRFLIEHNRIPSDVTIQVLTQARRHLIERTFESLDGIHQAIVHVYNATAPIMRRVVFGLEPEGIIKIATDHAQLMNELASLRPETQWTFEYSPEMFSGTELPFAKEISDAVADIWQATPEKPMILNLPSTVECATPNIFADQIEWMHRHLNRRSGIILSVHPHNDRGTGTAAAELALMAGADRLEGCLFGNGERTGNVDLVNIALNLYTQGIHPGLDFSRIDEIRQTVEYCNRLPVHPRHPYVGDLVYTSFSGSHQDAIKKAFQARKETDFWEIPYLPIDPKDLGRSYSEVIRVNSQSGKGGIAYLLSVEKGIHLPRRLQIEFSQVVQKYLDQSGQEMGADQLWQIFEKEYFHQVDPISYISHRVVEDSTKSQSVQLTGQIKFLDQTITLSATDNGPISAFVQSLNRCLTAPIKIMDYQEHALGEQASATAICYVEVSVGNHPTLFGVGMDTNIVTASFKAVLSALNRSHHIQNPLIRSEPSHEVSHH